MDRLMEWFFTADIKVFHVVVLIVAAYLGKAFLEHCYGGKAGAK